MDALTKSSVDNLLEKILDLLEALKNAAQDAKSQSKGSSVWWVNVCHFY